MLKIKSKDVEGSVKSSIRISIEYDLEASDAKWIFLGKIIEDSRDYRIESFEEDGVRKEDLIIDFMRSALQGIYTVQVEKNGCINSETVYVSLSA